VRENRISGGIATSVTKRATTKLKNAVMDEPLACRNAG
jgi:hypothetical protein